VHDTWWNEQLNSFTVGIPPQPMFRRATLAGSDRAAVAYAASSDAHEKLYHGYFEREPNRTEAYAATKDFTRLAYTETDDSRSIRLRFLRQLGDGAAEALRREGRESVMRAGGMPPDDKLPLLERLRDAAYLPSRTDYGRFRLTVDEGEHTMFGIAQILSDEIQGDMQVLRFVTRSGQTFTSRVNVTTGLLLSVTGERLRVMHLGRGVTRDSPAFSVNEVLNRSHVIANEFGGSGYREALNLLTTSARYNQIVMRGAEREIGRRVTEHTAERPPEERASVTFRVTVSVRWGDVLDRDILQSIRREPWYQRHSPGDRLEHEIRAKIREGRVSERLRRVMALHYIVAIENPGGAEIRLGPVISLGPDLYLFTG
jgi:hypothetical protein